MTSSSWKPLSQQLSIQLQSGGKDEAKTLELFKDFNALIYPVNYLNSEEADDLMRCILRHSRESSGDFKIQLAQLIYKLLTYQKNVTIQSKLLAEFLHLFLSSLVTTDPPSELLYASASILQAGVSHEDPAALLHNDHPIFHLSLSPFYPIEIQRAGLHFATILCETTKLPHPLLVVVSDALLKSMSTAPSHDTLLISKLLLSKLRLLHAILPRLSPFPSLPTLLSSLKANMVIGLPGQTQHTMTSMAVTPVPPSPSPSAPSSSKSKQMQSVAGPQERNLQGKGRGTTRNKRGSKGSRTSSEEDSSRQSSDSDLSSSTSEVSLSRWSPRTQHADYRTRGSGWGRRKGGVSNSDGEVSDSDSGLAKMRSVWSKIRYQAHSSLAVVFNLLKRHIAFSYWLSFLSNGPRPPNSPPLLFTCILKDPIPKCRGAALTVLCSMLEGSKLYLAAADDKPHPSQSFIPYSTTLGGVVRELHRSLLLALRAEPHSTTLTQIIKTLGLLTANSPYHQLSDGYITRVIGVMGQFSNHRDVNVQVACLTCYGALVSISPSHREVEEWLSCPDDPTGCPWLLQHCISILETQRSLVVQTESLQVITALIKFYFPQVKRSWLQLKDFYLSHLALLPQRVEQHVLKMLEELCRALASHPSPEVTSFWEELLSGPLTSVLQNYPERGNLSALGCDILSTISPQTMDAIKAPFQILALTLPLGLSKSDNAPTTVKASAVRVLGVFVLFDTLSEDDNFLLDCQSAIIHCLSSPLMAVRVQASWAFANLINRFSSGSHLLHPSLLFPLCEAVLLALQDGDKVKCNGVRAAGNLLKQLPQHIPDCEAVVDKLSLQLAKCVGSGSMKSRWNACYACHIAFTNPFFVSKFPSNVSKLLSALCLAVQDCKNFKVRSNAATALSNAAQHDGIGNDQFAEVWKATLQALENSEQQMDFSEFKHAATLKKQLCTTICHLLAMDVPIDVISSLPSHDLPHSSQTHVSYFLAQASTLDRAEKDCVEREQLLSLIEKAWLRLDAVVMESAALNGLWDLFKINAEMVKGSP